MQQLGFKGVTVTDSLTAVVGVADDGGSSGRLRTELGILPPGDLRMALAALCGDDSWGRTWQEVIQHRFGGDGELAGHSMGNLLIAAVGFALIFAFVRFLHQRKIFLRL